MVNDRANWLKKNIADPESISQARKKPFIYYVWSAACPVSISDLYNG